MAGHRHNIPDWLLLEHHPASAQSAPYFQAVVTVDVLVVVVVGKGEMTNIMENCTTLCNVVVAPEGERQQCLLSVHNTDYS